MAEMYRFSAGDSQHRSSVGKDRYLSRADLVVLRCVMTDRHVHTTSVGSLPALSRGMDVPGHCILPSGRRFCTTDYRAWLESPLAAPYVCLLGAKSHS